jgi:hypothetical protein
MYNTLWYVGSIVAAWTVFGTIGYKGDAAWRVPIALQALMPLIQFVGIWLLPESPRWLCSKDREEDALKVLIKVRLISQSSTESWTNTTLAVSRQRQRPRRLCQSRIR